MNLTKYERETTILFNEAEDTAEASAYNRRCPAKQYRHETYSFFLMSSLQSLLQ